MTPVQFYLALLIPTLTALGTLLAGVLFSNSRSAELRQLLQSMQTALEAQIRTSQAETRTEVVRLEASLLQKFAELDNRLVRLEVQRR